MQTRPESYRSRIVDAQIEQYLEIFGAVEICGTKWCGKTWSSLAHANSVTYVDRGNNLEIVKADPSYALIGESPHVIDEWQRVPALWDYVRHAVDEAGDQKGKWILTGSSTPVKGKVSHSGAGRIGRIRMHPMTLQETGMSSAEVSLEALFERSFSPCQTTGSITELAEICVHGGWPGALGMDVSKSQILVRSYISSILTKGVQELGGSESVARLLGKSIARTLGQPATHATLARDVFGLADDEIPTDSKKRNISEHLRLLCDLFFVDEVAGWVPASRSPKRMRMKPKRYFADPSIAVALLGLSPESLMHDWQTFGMVFENLCMRDLDVYARSLPNAGDVPLRYYHDDSGLEADAIIELADGSWGAFEIKLSPEAVSKAAGNLVRIRDKLLKVTNARIKEPSFLCVITGTGEGAYRRPDGVYVVPVRCLGA